MRNPTETLIQYDRGELIANGPGGRFAVRAYGPADPDEAEDERNSRSAPVDLVSFPASTTEPEQQTLDGFAVYKVLPNGHAWRADFLTLGAALDYALDLAEGNDPTREHSTLAVQMGEPGAGRVVVQTPGPESTVTVDEWGIVTVEIQGRKVTIYTVDPGPGGPLIYVEGPHEDGAP